MATIQDAVDQATNISTALTAVATSLAALLAAMTAAFNALDAKIAGGVDTSPILAVLAPISQSLADLKTQIDNATAQAQVQGQ